MCRLATCKTCGKPTYAGCGAHIEQVLGHVPQSDRCHCRQKATTRPATRDAGGKACGPLGRLLGRVRGMF